MTWIDVIKVNKIYGVLEGNATSATKANLTTTANAIAYYTDATGTFGTKASANGALYATTANGTLQWGILPVGQGGSGATTFTSGELLIGNGTDAIGTRAIINNTSAGALGWVSGNTNANNLRVVNVNTLAYWNGAYSGTNSNLKILGTVTTGEWKATTIATEYGGTGNTTFTKNTLIYAETATKLSSTSSIYASTTAITINGTAAPDNSGNFQVKGPSTFQHIYTQTDATYDLGATATRWRSAYFTTSLLIGAKSTITAYNSNALGSFIGPGVISSCVTAAGNGYYLIGQGAQYARLYINTIGTTTAGGQTILELGNGTATGTANNACGRICIYHTNAAYGEYYSNSWNSNGSLDTYTMVGATSTTANTDAWTTLVLGNNANKTTTTAHSQGNLRIYASNTSYTDIRSQGNGNRVFYLPNYTDTMYAVHAGNNNAIGSGKKPVYVAANGRVTVCDTTVGDPYTPVYSNAGELTAVSPIQYFTWTIDNGKKGVTLTGTNIFAANTYNVTLVVTSGEANLNGPITWTSAANTFTIQSSAATSGAVSGYAIVARGTDITSSLTSAQIS